MDKIGNILLDVKLAYTIKRQVVKSAKLQAIDRYVLLLTSKIFEDVAYILSWCVSAKHYWYSA